MSGSEFKVSCMRRLGHWEAACRSKSTTDGSKPSSQKPRRPRSQSRSGRRGNKQAVHQLRVNEDSNDDDTFQHLEFNSVTNNDGRDEIFATLDISLRNGARERDATLGAVVGVRRRIRRDEDTSSGLASLRTSELLLRIAGVRRNEAPRRNESPYSLRGHRRTAHA